MLVSSSLPSAKLIVEVGVLLDVHIQHTVYLQMVKNVGVDIVVPILSTAVSRFVMRRT